MTGNLIRASQHWLQLFIDALAGMNGCAVGSKEVFEKAGRKHLNLVTEECGHTQCR